MQSLLGPQDIVSLKNFVEVRAVGYPRTPTDHRGITVTVAHPTDAPWGLLGRHAMVRILYKHEVRAVARRSHGVLSEGRWNAEGSQHQHSLIAR